MEIKNRTTFAFAPMMGRVNFPAHTATLVVKAGWRITPAGLAPLEQPVAIAGDVPSAGEVPEMLYEADLGLFKPNAEIMLTGTCYTPGGKALTTCPVAFKVGAWSKTIAAIGNRAWQKALLSSKMGEVEPFNKLPLRWAHAFGGPEFKGNPAGKGHKGDLLPNLEYPDKLIKSRGDTPTPAAFGPISRLWPSRTGKMGTYDKKWLKERFPAQAADFDWTYYNAAPADQQLKGFMRGDEEVELTNMHPELPVQKLRLPALRVRLLLREGAENAPVESLKVREVPMNLDTLYVDADKGELYLLWRGIANISDADWLDCRDILIVSEALSAKPANIEQLLPQFTDPPEPEEEGEEPEEEPESPEQWQAKFDGEMKAGEAQMAASDKGAGQKAFEELQKHMKGKPQAPGSGQPGPVMPHLTQLLKTMGLPMPKSLASVAAAEASMYADPVVAQALASLKAPPAAAPAKPDAKATATMMRSGEAKGGDFSGADLSKQDLKGADLSECYLQGANLSGADLTGAKLCESLLTGANLAGAKLAGADLSDTDLTKANLEGADLVGAKLHEALLEGAILKGAKCEKADFAGAALIGIQAEGAGFKGAKLSECTFAKANVKGADFTEAELVDASMEEVNAPGAKFEKAKLDNFRGGIKSDFSGANFVGAQAAGSVFERSVLKNADFRGAILTRAQFQFSDLSGINLFGCDMAEATFRRASLAEAKAGNANFFRAQLEAADMQKGNFVKSNFYEAEFLDAKTGGADFAGANLKMTKLG